MSEKKIKNVTLNILDPGVSADKMYELVRNGQREITLIHEDLRSILEETNGVIVYQEQVMEILVKICNYTLEETDIIRGAIAKKKHDVMMAAFDRIRESTLARGWTKTQADQLCYTIQAFSRYSFNRSHSRAYAELGYITMFLKNKHKLEWWCSVLNNEDDEDKVRHFISLLSDVVRAPNMKIPERKFVIREGYIVAPLSVVKGVGPSVFNEIADKGPFIDIKDFCSRINHSKVNIGGISQLIKARAADDFFTSDLPYEEARLKFMEDYLALKKTNSKFKEELYNTSPLNMFLMEREVNTVFNKTVLTDRGLLVDICRKWPALKMTGRQGVPLMIGETMIVNGARVADGLLKSGEVQKPVGMFVLFKSSEMKSGISKKTGKPWKCLSIQVNDGFIDFEVISWDLTSALRFKKDTLLYIKGNIEKGWKSPISMKLLQLDVVEEY